jgi:predicted transposase/invertase (TIGR01784 family)
MLVPQHSAVTLLDPKLDVVFKLLFTREPGLLRAMLSAVLREEVTGLVILNPEVPGDLSDDKGIVLDILVELANKKRVVVEMQMRTHPALPERLLFYGARDYASQLQRGEEYEELMPTVVVVWLAEPLFEPSGPLHSIFELRERTSGRLFSDRLALHVLELSKLRAHQTSQSGGGQEEAGVLRWARFLVARNEEELTRLAAEDPIMDSAKNVLQQLSRDPAAARLARDRADGAKFYKMDLAASRREGVEEGREAGVKEGREAGVKEGREAGVKEGHEEGVAETLRASVVLLLTKRFGPLPESAERVLATADTSALQRMLKAIFELRSVDEALAFAEPVASGGSSLQKA